MLLPAMLVLSAVVAPDDVVLIHQEGPMEKVLQAAKDSGKPVLVDFFTEWCGWCKVMDRDVFSDAGVVEFANAKILLFRVDAEKGEGPALAKKYGVNGYPTFVFMDGTGSELDRQVGASDKAVFLGLMKDVHAGNHMASLKARVEKTPEDGELQALLGGKLALKGDPAAREHLEKAVALDPDSKRESTVAARFRLAVMEVNRSKGSPASVEAFVKQFPDSAQALDAHRMLAALFEREGNIGGQQASLEFIVRRAPDAAGRNELAWFYATHDKNLDRALTLADEALKDRPTDAAILDTRAECLSRLGRHAEALAAQEKAVASLASGTAPAERKQYEDRLAMFRAKADAAKGDAEKPEAGTPDEKK